jgi:hypothetical protein
MGLYQEMVYDRGNGTPTADVNRQLREFVLRYFLRVTDVCRPEAFAAESRTSLPALDRLSWCPERERDRAGFGFSQLYYKLASSGRIGRFPEHLESKIVDLRQIGDVYEWILLKVNIFDFTLAFRPLGRGRPRIVVPVSASNYLLLTREFVVDNAAGDDHTAARYGIGYAVIRSPEGEGLVAYGPGQFDCGIQTFDFALLRDGSVHVTMSFVVNRPVRILNVPTDPLEWGWLLADVGSLGLASRMLPGMREWLAQRQFRAPSFDALSAFIGFANAITGGLANQSFCISQSQLEKDFLVYHFIQHYEMIVGSLSTWSSVRDWTDEHSIPEWIRTGISDVGFRR